jgi:4-hydroxybutyrate CoA-transferase
MISDGVIDLVESGVINGSLKTLHPGKVVAGFVLGTRRLYHWVHENPALELHRTEYVKSPRVIAQNARMVAINSALQIDLTGQVCLVSIGTRFYSGAGGQFDFIYGASHAEDGLPMIGLPSTFTDRDGNMKSRIVPTLTIGAGVVTTRYHVHLVATEFGIVDLYGKSIRQRVQLLSQIAHPTFREELLRQARNLNYV